MKGRIVRGGFFMRTMSCETDQLEALQSAAAVSLLCRYWQLNDLFCCMCIYCSGFLPDNPQNCPFLWGSIPPFNTWFTKPKWVKPQTASWSGQPFLHSLLCAQHTDTDRQTTLRATSVATNHIYAMHAMLPQCTLTLVSKHSTVFYCNMYSTDSVSTP